MKINERADQLSELLRNEITARRTACGLSKNETATRAGLSVSFVSDLEHAKRRPTVETLAKLAWVFGTTPSEMLAACEKKLEE
ncbi:helix-turn-helix transcriptional regulator [Luteolibacter ambystomatis]|uniref:Helix-turn-helix transcriptional regulator n=1 Tax=Luteolibacter ambystomatis TaxID=2824561 RepID=A0A975PGT5_9BACT|nr:helix-turn-helix transcriptional regulator [Luteolibacter ambystomatis]